MSTVLKINTHDKKLTLKSGQKKVATSFLSRSIGKAVAHAIAIHFISVRWNGELSRHQGDQGL
jgi:hypothetical protein